MKKIAILIPCYNEEKSIGRVIDEIPIVRLKNAGYLPEILVIDNNSTDNTSKIARKKGAKIIPEEKQGKGNAIICGLKNIKKEIHYIVMIDGDSTYNGNEILSLIEPLENNFCDVVIGSRIKGKTERYAMPLLNKIGNRFFTFFVRQLYRANITDALSGFSAWKREVIEGLLPNLNSKGFSIEMEIVTKTIKSGYKIFSVPITYRKRIGKSKLSPFSDGLKIAEVLIKNLFWRKTIPKT